MKNKILTVTGITIIAYCLCAIQSIVCMDEYEGWVSSTCMGCSLISEVHLLCTIILWVFPLCFLVMGKVKFRYKLMAFTLIYALICFWVNDNIFVSREAAWSTYTLPEELRYVVHDSWVGILVSGVVFCLCGCFISVSFVKK